MKSRKIHYILPLVATRLDKISSLCGFLKVLAVFRSKFGKFRILLLILSKIRLNLHGFVAWELGSGAFAGHSKGDFD